MATTDVPCTVLPIPTAVARADHLRREGPGHGVPADQAAAAAGGRAERAGGPARRAVSGVSAFGGPCAHPTLRTAGRGGLRYNRFHTTALCSPTRQALLTGRNHHSVGMGGITEIATSAPGYSSLRPNTKAPLAETLKLNGYSTAQFGKCHEVPVWQTSPMGPFDAWPLGAAGSRLLRVHRRREQPVGPGALRGNHPGRAADDARGGLPPDRGPGRPGHRLGPAAEGADARQAVLRVLRPGRHPRPAPRARRSGRTSTGRFDDGWDAQRERTFARQKELGVIPPDAELTARPRGDPGLGRHAGRAQAGAGPPDGGVRRLPRAHRPPRRPAASTR